MRQPASLALALSMVCEARRSAVPLASVTMQPMPVLHGGVAHIAELRLSPGGLAVESAVGIASARMRVVFTLLAVEVGATAVGAAAVLGAETLMRGPRLDQRSVHRKMLVRQQRLNLRMVEKFAHELGKHRAGLQ